MPRPEQTHWYDSSLTGSAQTFKGQSLFLHSLTATRRRSGTAGAAGAELAATLGTARDGPNGVITNSSRDLPAYAVDEKNGAKAFEARLNRIDEPPAYTARDLPQLQQHVKDIVAADAPDREHGVADSTPLQSWNSTIERDLVELRVAIVSYRDGESGAKCRAKRAGKQLVRDLWAVEEVKRGGYSKMSWGEKKEVKARVKALKHAVKAEIRAVK